MPTIRNKFGETVPDVFIGQIVISRSSDFTRHHGKSETSVPKTRKKDKYFKKRDLKKRQKRNSQLKVRVRLYLKEICQSSQKHSTQPFWYRRKGIYANLKIRVMQSLSRSATRDITNNLEQMFSNGYFEKYSDASENGIASPTVSYTHLTLPTPPYV